VMAHRQQVVRIDKETKAQISAASQRALKKTLEKKLTEADGVLLVDYDKGVLSKGILSEMAKVSKSGRPVCADPKPQNVKLFRDITLVCPNEGEALQATHESDYNTAGKILLKELNVKAVLVTLGPQGVCLFRKKQKPFKLGTFALEDSVGDTTGCGDTVNALLTAALATSATFEEAIELANYAAGITANYVGVHAPSADEILAAIELHTDK